MPCALPCRSMAKTLNVESMLRSSFLVAELKFLKDSPRFADALPLVSNSAQFERLCELGEELLGAYNRANPAAKQFRTGRHKCE